MMRWKDPLVCALCVHSSIGRAAVSKAAGSGFKSWWACVNENEYDKIVLSNGNGGDVVVWCVVHGGPRAACGCG